MEPESEEGVTGGSQSSTERVSSATPLPESSQPVVQSAEQVKGLIEEGELTAFMSGEEGRSVFQAWRAGGFTTEQITRLYGEHVLEAFWANALVMDTGASQAV